MILNVDLASEVPIYQRLRDRIVMGSPRACWPRVSSLPATRTLAADFGINFHTVNKAYDLLRQQGPDPAQPQDRRGGDLDGRGPAATSTGGAGCSTSTLKTTP
ncbi:DNA-binding transcriptional MocR family regulator [Arthrobacter sp. GAS37]